MAFQSTCCAGCCGCKGGDGLAAASNRTFSIASNLFSTASSRCLTWPAFLVSSSSLALSLSFSSSSAWILAWESEAAWVGEMVLLVEAEGAGEGDLSPCSDEPKVDGTGRGGE